LTFLAKTIKLYTVLTYIKGFEREIVDFSGWQERFCGSWKRNVQEKSNYTPELVRR